MKKRFVIVLLSVVALGGIFYGTYQFHSNQIDKSIGEVTDEQLEEIDDHKIKELTLYGENGEEYSTFEEMQGLNVGEDYYCTAVLESGTEVETKAYVVNGDDNHVEYNNGAIKVTIKGE